jgi:hypothetical protein
VIFHPIGAEEQEKVNKDQQDQKVNHVGDLEKKCGEQAFSVDAERAHIIVCQNKGQQENHKKKYVQKRIENHDDGKDLTQDIYYKSEKQKAGLMRKPAFFIDVCSGSFF